MFAAFGRGKLAHYKVPRLREFVTSSRQTVTGKIQKFKIREQIMEELGLREKGRREVFLQLE